MITFLSQSIPNALASRFHPTALPVSCLSVKWIFWTPALKSKFFEPLRTHPQLDALLALHAKDCLSVCIFAGIRPTRACSWLDGGDQGGLALPKFCLPIGMTPYPRRPCASLKKLRFNYERSLVVAARERFASRLTAPLHLRRRQTVTVTADDA